MSLLALAGIAEVLQWAPLELPVLTGSDRSMQQYTLLRERAERGDVCDWLALGNSFTRQSVDPLQVDAIWSKHLGRELSGYNFGSGGIAVSMLPAMLELAYAGPAPAGSAVAIFVVQPSMLFTRSAAIHEREALVAASPYGRALGDPIAWRGRAARALLDHVRAAGLRYRFKALLLGGSDEDTRWERLASSESRGYVRIEEEWKAPGPGAWMRFLRYLDGGFDSEEATQQLAAAMRLARARGARSVLVVEGAMHPGAGSRLVDAGVPISRIRGVLADAARAAGATLLTLAHGPAFSEADFRDPKHLNAGGARRYSRWLGNAFPVEDVFGAQD